MTYAPAHPPASLRGIVTGLAGYAEHATTPVVRRQGPTGGATLILAWGGPLLVEGFGGPEHHGASSPASTTRGARRPSPATRPACRST